MEKRLRSSMQCSAEEFIHSATKQSLKSSKPTLRTLIHGIKPSSDLLDSLPISLRKSISNSIETFRGLKEGCSTQSDSLKSPPSPPTKRLRRSSRNSKTRNEPEPERHGSNIDEEKQKIIESLEVLAHIALLCASHPQNAFSLSDLFPSVQALHDNLIIFESYSALLSSIASLCELWWKENFPGRELLISQSLPYLLSRSLTLKKKVDVHRINVLREAFTFFDFEDDSIEDLKLLLIRCVISPLYLKTEDGRRFLVFTFGLSNQLVKEMLAMIRSQIPFGRKSMLEAYGDILFRAWRSAGGNLRCEMENEFLQDLVEAAIHARSGAFAASIRRVLGAFINQRTTEGVQKLLFRLSEPVIFRSLQVANPNVRQNALHLLLDMFPMEDPDATKDVMDTLLNKQFFLLERLLVDDCPDVRVVAVEGSCRILNLFWEIIPSPSITKIITTIVDDMSHDICNEVRLSTLSGIIYLLGNPLSHEILRVLLPRLGHLMIDNILSIRVATADLLLLLNDVRNFQFNKVVQLDVLLSVLANDQPMVAQKVSRLLLPSYFPSKLPVVEACNRCITLVKRSPMAGARFCEFAFSEGASMKYLMELLRNFVRLVLSPGDLEAHQVDGFLLGAANLHNKLVSDSHYKNAIKELFAGETVKGLFAAASTGLAQTSLFNMVSNIPDDATEIIEECMCLVTNCIGLPEDVVRQAEMRSAHKLLLSSGCFDGMLEALTSLLQRSAYHCHVKFGIDMPRSNFSLAKRKKCKSFSKISTRWKHLSMKKLSNFEDDYAIAVGVGWQVKELLLHEDTRKAMLGSQSLESLLLALMVIAEISIVHCMHYDYINTGTVLACSALALQITVHNVGLSNIKNPDKKNLSDSSAPSQQTLLEFTMDYLFNCTKMLIGADDPSIAEKLSSESSLCKNKSTYSLKEKLRQPLADASSPSNDGCILNVPRKLSSKLQMLTAVLKFVVDSVAMCLASHNHPLCLSFTSECVKHMISSFNQLSCDLTQFNEEDLRDISYCLKSLFTYAAKLLNLVLRDFGESSSPPPEAFDIANGLLDLVVSTESYLGSGYAARMVAAAKLWLPDILLALGSLNIMKQFLGNDTYLSAAERIKLHFPEWPSIIAKIEASKIGDVPAEEDKNIHEQDKFSAFNRLLNMIVMLLKGNPKILDAVGAIFLSCSIVGLERKDFELVLGLLHFVRLKLFKQDDKDWGDMMLASLQEIYTRVEGEAEELGDEDQQKLNNARELLEPVRMYHIYETGRVSVSEE